MVSRVSGPVVGYSLQSLADTGAIGVMPPPQSSDEFFVMQTDFRTHWPTPQVVIMQTGVQVQGAALLPDPLSRGSAPDQYMGTLPQTPVTGSHSPLTLCPQLALNDI